MSTSEYLFKAAAEAPKGRAGAAVQVLVNLLSRGARQSALGLRKTDRVVGKAGGFDKGLFNSSEKATIPSLNADALGYRLTSPVPWWLGGNQIQKGVDATLNNRVAQPILKAVDAAYLGGLRPGTLAKDKFGIPLSDKAVKNLDYLRPLPIAMGGTAVALGEQAVKAKDAYKHRNEIAADQISDRIARSAELTPGQRDDTRAAILQTLREGKTLDATALTGLTSNLTPGQASAVRSMLYGSLRDWASRPEDANRAPPSSTFASDIYDATRYFSPGAYAAKHVVHGGIDAIKKLIAKPYDPQDIETDINSYLAKAKRDPEEANSATAKAIGAGINRLSESQVERGAKGYLGEARKDAFGIPLSGNLEKDIGKATKASPEEISKAIFTSGGLPIAQTISAAGELNRASNDTRNAARRTVAETAYDNLKDDLPKVTRPTAGQPQPDNSAQVQQALRDMPKTLNKATKFVRELPDTVNVPKAIEQAKAELPKYVPQASPASGKPSYVP
jgi:hypothetical protein